MPPGVENWRTSAEQPGLVERDCRVDLRVGPFEVDVGDDGRAAVARAGDVDHVAIALLDQAVELDVDEAQARRGPPVTEQPRLDVLRRAAARAAAGLPGGRSGATVR